MYTNTEKIINWAYKQAIHIHDLLIIKACIDARCEFTDEHISLVKDNILCADYKTYNPKEYADLFNLLSTNYFVQFASNTEFMIACISHPYEFYLKTMIDKGYNSTCPDAQTVFLKSLDRINSQKIELLAGCGFSQYFQSGVMECIKENNLNCIKILFEHGVSFYSELQNIYNYVFSLNLSWSLDLEAIHFALDNMYNIKSLLQPIKVNLLLMDCEFISADVRIHIMFLYMATDYAMTDKIRDRLYELHDNYYCDDLDEM